MEAAVEEVLESTGEPSLRLYEGVLASEPGALERVAGRAGVTVPRHPAGYTDRHTCTVSPGNALLSWLRRSPVPSLRRCSLHLSNGLRLKAGGVGDTLVIDRNVVDDGNDNALTIATGHVGTSTVNYVIRNNIGKNARSAYIYVGDDGKNWGAPPR